MVLRLISAQESKRIQDISQQREAYLSMEITRKEAQLRDLESALQKKEEETLILEGQLAELRQSTSLPQIKTDMEEGQGSQVFGSWDEAEDAYKEFKRKFSGLEHSHEAAMRRTSLLENSNDAANLQLINARQEASDLHDLVQALKIQIQELEKRRDHCDGIHASMSVSQDDGTQTDSWEEEDDDQDEEQAHDEGEGDQVIYSEGLAPSVGDRVPSSSPDPQGLSHRQVATAPTTTLLTAVHRRSNRSRLDMGVQCGLGLVSPVDGSSQVEIRDVDCPDDAWDDRDNGDDQSKSDQEGDSHSTEQSREKIDPRRQSLRQQIYALTRRIKSHIVELQRQSQGESHDATYINDRQQAQAGRDTPIRTALMELAVALDQAALSEQLKVRSKPKPSSQLHQRSSCSCPDQFDNEDCDEHKMKAEDGDDDLNARTFGPTAFAAPEPLYHPASPSTSWHMDIDPEAFQQRSFLKAFEGLTEEVRQLCWLNPEPLHYHNDRGHNNIDTNQGKESAEGGGEIQGLGRRTVTIQNDLELRQLLSSTDFCLSYTKPVPPSAYKPKTSFPPPDNKGELAVNSTASTSFDISNDASGYQANNLYPWLAPTSRPISSRSPKEEGLNADHDSLRRPGHKSDSLIETMKELKMLVRNRILFGAKWTDYADELDQMHQDQMAGVEALARNLNNKLLRHQVS